MKNLLVACWMFISSVAQAVDVNTASAFELESMPHVGQKLAQSIVDERVKNGAFKNWDDFTTRIKGIGERGLSRLHAKGLTLKLKD